MNRLPQNIVSKEDQTKMIEDNVDLPEILASKIMNNAGAGCSLTRDDLISAGSDGLMQGAVRYNPEKGASPRTYLSHWVNSAIMRAVYKSRNVHIPFNRINKVTKSNKNGDAPTIDIPREISLDASDDGDFTASISADKLESHLVKTDTSNPDDKECIEFLIDNSSLSSIEKMAIIHRFGLMGEYAKTLKQVSQISGYTIMGIKKAQDRALKKIGNNPIFKDVYA